MTAEQDLSCLFQSIDELPAEPISAEVKGNLPSWLSGTLIRNGPGRFECGDTSFNHWFDGQGLLHRFHIEGGHVTYSNKFVRSESYADSLKHGDAIHYEFGSFIPPDPCQNIFTRFFSRFLGDEVPVDNTSVNVFPMKEKLYTATDGNCIFEINPETLDTLKKVNFTKEFPGDTTIHSATAHAHQTPDGSVINISVTYGRISTYNVIQIPPSSGKPDESPLEGGKVLCSFPSTGGAAYMHSFGLTENYVVVTETPLVLNVWRYLTRRITESCFLEWLYWDANQLARFHVVDRKQGTRLGTFTAEPFFTFHHINAFEEDGKIYLDACCYQDSSIVSQMYLHNLRSPIVPGEQKLDVADARRYELPLEDLGDVHAENPLHKGADGLDYTLLYSGFELPRFNYGERNGKPYKFVYGVADVNEVIFGQLVKLNVETKDVVTWKEPGGFVSEPVFVKAPDGKEEDDGVVLSCVINIPDQTTSLLVLDAKDFKELGRAVVKRVTPMSLHGLFQEEMI
ncbi:carotenoid-cleaving dioxygenase, mitochondrial-like [Oculina patagonica]